MVQPRAGQRVILTGFTTTTEYNGLEGIVLRSGGRGRWEIDLGELGKKAVREENLELFPFPEENECPSSSLDTNKKDSEPGSMIGRFLLSEPEDDVSGLKEKDPDHGEEIDDEASANGEQNDDAKTGDVGRSKQDEKIDYAGGNQESREDFGNMCIDDLKKCLALRGISCSGIKEKSKLVELCLQPTANNKKRRRSKRRHRNSPNKRAKAETPPGRWAAGASHVAAGAPLVTAVSHYGAPSIAAGWPAAHSWGYGFAHPGFGFPGYAPLLGYGMPPMGAVPAMHGACLGPSMVASTVTADVPPTVKADVAAIPAESSDSQANRDDDSTTKSSHPKSRDEAMRRAEKRMESNRHTVELHAEVTAFVKEHRISNEVELGLRLLPSSSIKRVLASSEFRRKIQDCSDKAEAVLAAIAKENFEVEGIARVLKDGGRDDHCRETKDEKSHRHRRHRHTETVESKKRSRSRRRRRDEEPEPRRSAGRGRRSSDGHSGRVKLVERAEADKRSRRSCRRSVPPTGVWCNPDEDEDVDDSPPVPSQAPQVQPIVDESADPPIADETSELEQWIIDLDSGRGFIAKYLDPIVVHYGSLAALADVVLEHPLSPSPIGQIDPYLWTNLGAETLGHKLLLAKGILKLRQQLGF